MSDKLAKHMADVIGHGMSEKCERHAEIAEEFYSERIQELEHLVSEAGFFESMALKKLEWSEKENKKLSGIIDNARHAIADHKKEIAESVPKSEVRKAVELLDNPQVNYNDIDLINDARELLTDNKE